MKKTLAVVLQLSALGMTAFAFIATSPPPPECDPAGPVRYAVNSSCGPSGFITVSNTRSCELQVTGAEDVNLPGSGTVADGTTLLVGFELSEFVTYLEDGGVDRDGGRSVPSADGGAPDRIARCSAKPASDGGTLSVMDLECRAANPSAQVLCSGSLVQDGQLADAGAADAGTDGGAP